jgi:hypothetical protein
MEAVNTSETLVSFYQNTQRNIPENGYLHLGLISEMCIISDKLHKFCHVLTDFEAFIAASSQHRRFVELQNTQQASDLKFALF